MSQHVPPPPGELRNVQVKFVSLVKQGANGRKFQVFKAAGYEQPAEEPAADQAPKGLGEMISAAVQKALQAIGLAKAEPANPADVEKAGADPPTDPPTFNAQMQAKEQRDAFWSALYVFEDVIREITWSAAADKVNLISQAIDDFKGYILPRVPAFNVQKADDEPVEDAVDGDISNIEEGIAYVNVAKAGRKISTGRLARLKEAYAHLGDVIAQAEQPDDEPATTPKEDVKVQKEELAQIVKEALSPLEERLAKLEGTEEQPATEQTENTAEIVKSAVSEALAPVVARLEKVEKARGVSNAQPTEEVQTQKSGSFSWGGSILGE